MSWLLFGVIIVGVVWFLSSVKSQQKAGGAFKAFDEAEAWFTENSIISDSIKFGSYEKSGLAVNSGATILAGTGKKTNGNDVGFIIEVITGRGVVLGKIIEPYGIVTWHKSAARQAENLGKPLVEVLLAMAQAHKAKYENEE